MLKRRRFGRAPSLLVSNSNDLVKQRGIVRAAKQSQSLLEYSFLRREGLLPRNQNIANQVVNGHTSGLSLGEVCLFNMRRKIESDRQISTSVLE
jgi:hypothetical protein